MELRAGLVRLRKELGMTQAELAAKLNVSFTTLSRWENRKTVPTPALAEAMMTKIRAMDVSPSCIAYLEDAFFPKKDEPVEKLRRVDMLHANQLLNESANGIVVMDPKTYEILYLNRTVERNRGIPAGDLCGQKCYEYLLGRSAPCASCPIERLSADEYVTREVRSVAGHYYATRGKLIEWEGKTAHIEYLSDITDSRRVQERLRDLTDRLPGGIAICRMNQDGQFSMEYANEGFWALLGDSQAVDREETDRDLFDRVCPDDRAKLFEALAAAAADDHIADVEVRLRHRNGHFVWCRIRGTVAEKTAEQTTLYLTCADFSRKKQLALALEDSRRTAELASEPEELELWNHNQNPAEDGRAVGAALQANQQKMLEARLEAERQKMASYDASLLRYVVVNITRNEVVEHREFRDDIAKAAIGTSLGTMLANVEQHARRDESWAEYCRVHHGETLTELYNSGTTTLSIEGLHHAEGGETIWIRNVMNLLRDPGSNDLYLFEYAYNIHSQRMQEEILHAAVNLDYERLASLSLQTGKLTRVFNRSERDDILLQTDAYDAVCTEYCARCVPPEDQELFLRSASIDAVRRALREQGSYKLTHRVVADGGIQFKCTRFVQYDDEKQLVLMTRTDVTDLVQEEEHKRLELQASNEEKTKLLVERERLYAALYSIIPMVISANLTQNRYEMMNYDDFYAKAAKESGTFDELIAVGASTVPEEDRQEFLDTFSREHLMEAYARGEKKIVLEHRQIGDDGALHWTKTMLIFVKSNLNDDLCEITLARDITARKQQEQQLQAALEAAEAANQAKSEFLSRISHEIRTPMNAIMGMTAIAKESCTDAPQVFECLDKIDLSSHYLLTLINDILEMGRIESGHTEIARAEFSFATFLESVRTVVGALALKSDLRFEFVNRVEGDSCYEGDMMRLQQILVNLISNAIKFTKAGGRVRFVAEIVSQTDSETRFRFTVADTGIGMSPAFMEKMFEPFTQEDGKTTSQFGGSGLGLAISKNLVQAMGGTLQAESEVGVGSTFVAEIPLVRAQLPQNRNAAGSEPAVQALLRGAHVLMAEDHPLNVAVARKILQKRGVTVTVAENGQAAVDTFRESALGAFDAILMDIRMPVMDGLDAARAIRALPRTDARTIPIIAMTANALDEDRKKSREAGMNAHLAKPFEPAQLYEVLATQIEKTKSDPSKAAGDGAR